MSYLDELRRKKEIAAQKAQRDAELKQTTDTTRSSGDAVAKEVAQQAAKNRASTQNVQVENPDLAKSNDVGAVTDAINKLNFTTFVAQSGSFSNIVESLASLCERMQSVMDGMEKDSPDKIVSAFATASSALQAAVNSVKNIKIKTDADVVGGLQKLNDTISSLQMSPVVNVPTPKVTVNEKEVDLSPLTGLLESVEKAVKDNKVALPDNSDLRGDIQAISKAIKSLSFPVPNYILPFRDTTGKAVQVVLDSNGNVPTSNTVQTDGTQQTKITDGTNIVNVLKSDGTAAGQNAQLVAGGYLTVPFTTTSAQAVASTDAGNYRWVSVHVVTQGSSSVVNFQGSNDNTNWVTATLIQPLSTVSAAQGSTSSANTLFHGPLGFRYFRLNVTGISAGTTAGVVQFSAVPSALQSMGVSASQSGTWTVGANSAVGSAVPANAFYMGMLNGTGNLQGLQTALSAGDAASGNSVAAFEGYMFNNTTHDRPRNNTTGVIVAAGTTSTQTAVALTTYNAKKLVVIVNITAGAGSLVVTINGATSTSYVYTLLTSASLTGTSTTALRIFPGATPAANLVANDVIPRTVQVTATVTGSITYGIDYVLGV